MQFASFPRSGCRGAGLSPTVCDLSPPLPFLALVNLRFLSPGSWLPRRSLGTLPPPLPESVCPLRLAVPPAELHSSPAGPGGWRRQRGRGWKARPLRARSPLSLANGPGKRPVCFFLSDTLRSKLMPKLRSWACQLLMSNWSDSSF